MSNRKKPKRKRRKEITTAESKSTEATTVAWMLSILATIAAELTALVLRGYVVLTGETGASRLVVVGDVLLVVAMITGAVTLVLTGLTLRARRVAPPQLIIVTALVCGALPTIVMILRSLRG